MIKSMSSSVDAMKTLFSKGDSADIGAAGFFAAEVEDVKTRRTKTTGVCQNMIRKQVRARAPLRLGFAGGGTDISPFSDKYGGFVVNASIDKYAYATILSRDDGLVELIAADGQMSWMGRRPRPSLRSTGWNCIPEFTTG